MPPPPQALAREAHPMEIASNRVVVLAMVKVLLLEVMLLHQKAVRVLRPTPPPLMQP